MVSGYDLVSTLGPSQGSRQPKTSQTMQCQSSGLRNRIGRPLTVELKIMKLKPVRTGQALQDADTVNTAAGCLPVCKGRQNTALNQES